MTLQMLFWRNGQKSSGVCLYIFGKIWQNVKNIFYSLLVSYYHDKLLTFTRRLFVLLHLFHRFKGSVVANAFGSFYSYV